MVEKKFKRAAYVIVSPPLVAVCGEGPSVLACSTHPGGARVRQQSHTGTGGG